MEERWAAVLAPPVPAGAAAPQQRILAVAAHTPGEAVGSPARVLGSGELKFKYLNPNTLLVAVGEPRGARSGHAAGDASAGAGPRLTVTLLDVVSGRVLFIQAHEVSVALPGLSTSWSCWKAHVSAAPGRGATPALASSGANALCRRLCPARCAGRHRAGARSAVGEHGCVPLLGQRGAPLAGGLCGAL